jgi:hypothetical protein
VKKILFCISLLLLVCTLFHLQILGIAAKIALKIESDCELAYRSLEWEEGELVFSDLVLFDSRLHTHIQRAAIRFDWSSFPKKLKAHLNIDHPHVLLLKKRTLAKPKSRPWFELLVSVQEGSIDWGEGAVRFSLEQQEERTEIALNWQDAHAFFTKEKGKLEAQLKNFKLSLLKPWVSLGELYDGRATGKFSVDEEGAPLAANLEFKEVGFALAESGFKGLSGTFSFNVDLGAKWELAGMAKAEKKEFPFHTKGKSFFKSNWLESELSFDHSWCHIARDEKWVCEVHELRSEEVIWLQSALLAVRPNFTDWAFKSGKVNGKAEWHSSSSWKASFQAEDLMLQKKDHPFACKKAEGDLTHEGGSFTALGDDYEIQFAGMWENWTARARLGAIQCALQGGWEEEKWSIQIEKGTVGDLEFVGHGWVDSQFDLFFRLDGDLAVLERKIPFHCPQLSKQGKDWTFDFRCVRSTWDLFRLAGTYDGEKILYHEKSHLLGEALHFIPAPVGDLNVYLSLPWKTLLSAGPFLKDWGLDLKHLPPLENTHLHLRLNEGLIDLIAEGTSPPFLLHVAQKPEEWKVDLQSDLAIQAMIKKDGSMKGKGSWKTCMAAEFEGKVYPSLHCEFSLPKVSGDLALIDSLNMKGKIKGQGHIIYNGEIESDFDLIASSLVLEGHALENEGPIHLYYSSLKGVLLRGIDLHGPFDCIIDLLEYDLKRASWICHHAQVHAPVSLFTHPFFQFLDQERDLNFTADLDFASDFSTFVCSNGVGMIPYQGSSYPLEKVNFSWNHGKCTLSTHYLNQLYRLHLQMGDHIGGRVILGEEKNPLAIDWEYDEKLLFHSIEGSFRGIDASFHAEKPNQLVGSAHLNCTALREWVPADLAEAFQELKMGQGYEVKGRLKIENNQPYFQGLLSGKAIELFGFQFRTLLAQIDIAPDCVRIYDAKISDSAGILKIDEILMEGKNQQPWTLSIPHLTILDLRPSLLQRPGGSVGPIDPLVVRELKINDLQGLLADGKTYTAIGNLHFINSYKREESILDLPANVLGRIVGLDLELLIPVTGDLSFDLKEGYFNLLELSNAYSESKRSQFFLEMDPPPRMDLDGNLQIFIKMKQFVLLKITESLFISIEGVLDDPQIHLKKKRFFGLI